MGRGGGQGRPAVFKGKKWRELGRDPRPDWSARGKGKEESSNLGEDQKGGKGDLAGK